MAAADVVDAFIGAIQRKDLDAALALATDDIEYDNVPLPTAHGTDAVRGFLEPLLAGAESVEWVVHEQVAAGDVVMNERTDRFLVAGRWVEIPVAGVWKVRNGKIALWRDYFDMQMFTDQLAGNA